MTKKNKEQTVSVKVYKEEIQEDGKLLKSQKILTPSEGTPNFLDHSQDITFQKEILKLAKIQKSIEKDKKIKLKKSLEAQKTFSQVAKINVPFPKDYIYSISETDEDLLIISGINTRSNIQLKLIAGRQLLTTEEAIVSIKEEPELIQIPKEYYQALQNLKPYQKLTDSSFSNGAIDIYYGQDNDDHGMVVVFGSRADKEGSYMAVFFSSINILEQEEDRLLDLLEASEIIE